MEQAKKDQLFADFKNGNERSFAAIHNDMKNAAYTFAMLFLDGNEEIDEVVNDSFLAVWNYRNKLQAYGSIVIFMKVTIKNKCIDRLRMRDRRRKNMGTGFQSGYASEYFSGDWDHEEEIQFQNKEKKVIEKINKVAEKQRDVLLLWISGIKSKKIQQLFGLTHTRSVSNYAQNGIKKLTYEINHSASAPNSNA